MSGPRIYLRGQETGTKTIILIFTFMQDWQIKAFNLKTKVIYNPRPSSKSWYFGMFRIETMMRYYHHRFELIIEDRVVKMEYPARYGWIAIDEATTRDRLLKGSWISNL